MAEQARLGVAVMVWRNQQLLLGERINADKTVCWQFPGGHIELGESVLQCARREVEEETGLHIEQCQTAGYSENSAVIAGREYFTLYVSAICAVGKPHVMEPDKAVSWQWFDLSALPQPLFLPIENYLKQHPDLSVFHP